MKNIRNLLITIVVIIFILIAYIIGRTQRRETFITKPTAEQLQLDMGNKEKCRIAGEVLYQQDTKDAVALDKKMLDIHEYAYNNNLNTCLYEGGNIFAISDQKAKFGHDTIYTWWIKDSLSNKLILTISYGLDQIACNNDNPCTRDRSDEVNAFFKQVDNLMGH